MRILGITASASILTGSFESIATTTLSTTTTNITFSSIPGTYQHLQIRMLSRASNASIDRAISLRLNGDTATNYAYHYLDGDGATASATGLASATSMVSIKTAGASAGANTFGVCIIDIHDYASTTKTKTVRLLNGFDNNGAGNILIASGLWNSTSAVNSFTIVNTSFLSGTTVALYGVKGA